MAKLNRGTRPPIPFTLNGREVTGHAEPRMLLSDFLIQEIGVTSTHVGCEHGVCGACTILLDGAPIRSCLMFAVQAEGRDIRTVEGLAERDNLHPLQQAFIDHHALQCGFCTPGMITRAAKLLEENPSPSEEEVRFGMAGNICRCTGYKKIVEAIVAAANGD